MIMTWTSNWSVVALVVLLSAVSVSALLDDNQQPLLRPYGFTSGLPSAPIVFEMHADILCSDAKEEWDSTISSLLKSYSSNQVYFIFHPFPLPYHRNAFLATKAGYAVNHVHAGSFLPWMEAIFAIQDEFLTGAVNLTESEVVSKLAGVASQFGVSSSQFSAAWNNPDIEMQTRAQWKFSTSRGVFGSPMYFLNGVRILSADFRMSDWKNLFSQYLNSAK